MTLTHSQVAGICIAIGLLIWFIIAHYCKRRYRREGFVLPTTNHSVLPPPNGLVVVRDNNNNQTILSLNRQQHEILKNSLTPSMLDYDVKDTSFQYVDKIIDITPENQLMPLQVLDQKYEEENCGFCLDPLKYKGRPIAKLGCNEHYYHYSCFKTFVEDDKKKKNVGLIFGEIQKVDDMFTIICPICQTKTKIDKIFIEYPNISVNDEHNMDINNDCPVIEIDDVSTSESPTELTPLFKE